MANMRSKNRKTATISLTVDENKASLALVKAGLAPNRSDLMRLAFNEWRELASVKARMKKPLT